MGLTMTSAPVRKAIELEEMKLHLREDQSDLDAEIEWKLEAATNTAESFTKRQFINATYEQTFERFPRSGDDLVLYRSPLSSVTSIAYLDADSVSQTVGVDVYGVDTSEEPGRVYLKQGQSWPATANERNAITVTFVSGYGTDAASVPAAIRDSIARLGAHLHNQEGVVIIGTIVADVPLAFRYLLQPYVVPWNHATE